jgi:hypothetical protein
MRRPHCSGGSTSVHPQYLTSYTHLQVETVALHDSVTKHNEIRHFDCLYTWIVLDETWCEKREKDVPSSFSDIV